MRGEKEGVDNKLDVVKYFQVSGKVMENIMLVYGIKMGKFSYKKLGLFLRVIILRFIFDYLDDKIGFVLIF